MESIVVRGGRPLNGTLRVQGSKNSALPILAACVLTDGVCVLNNCPVLTDVGAAVKILRCLGCRVTRAGHTLTVDARDVSCDCIPFALMREMRSSIVFLGAMLSRLGRAKLCAPGGCEIGARPIDLHLAALRTLGVQVTDCDGALDFRVTKRLRGAVIRLPFPSVGATENVMLAAVFADGQTTVLNAAREPEIEDLARFLNACGCRVHLCAGGTVVINGVRRAHGAEHTVIPDRIAALGTMAATAACGGDVTLTDVVPAHFQSVHRVFLRAGCRLDVKADTLRIRSDGRLRAVGTICTLPYPGFPTDAQAAVMAMLCTAKGTSRMTETIFERRFNHVPQLQRMGAHIKIKGNAAVISGVTRLHGAAVCAGDLRAGGALVAAALAAEGVSTITGVHHIDRGYEDPEGQLRMLGADIERSGGSGNETAESE
ncbi:MAG: UDP-N-acetylglucosamine 1-carboxyvinyltransferase [Clostridia bacterium]|nr:UDP-N-acetylglucosamine 1-carboxyvinyltransferase [Clostridia bacterium]